MSYIIHNATHAPAKNGMIISQNTSNPKAYSTVAYCHPNSPTTFFSAAAGTAYFDEKLQAWMHAGLVTSVKGKTIPDKPDNLVWAISYAEYERLAESEKKWWSAFDEFKKRPGSSYSKAVAHAHALVVKEKW